MKVPGKAACFTFKFIEARKCAYPNIPFPILHDVGNLVVADGVVVLEAMVVNNEFIAIVPVQAIAGANPHKPAAILYNGSHIYLRQTLSGTDMLELKALILRKAV